MLWRARKISVCTLFVKWLKFKLIYCQCPSKSVTFYMHTSKMGSCRPNREWKKLTPYITHESYISQTANSAIFLSGKNKHTNGSSTGRVMNNFYIIYYFCHTFKFYKHRQALELNSVYSRENWNTFFKLKTANPDLLEQSDCSLHCIYRHRWRETQLK